MYKSNSSYSSSSARSVSLTNGLSRESSYAKSTNASSKDTQNSSQKTSVNQSSLSSSKAVRALPVLSKSRFDSLTNGNLVNDIQTTNILKASPSRNGTGSNSSLSSSSSHGSPSLKSKYGYTGDRTLEALTAKFSQKTTISYRTDLKPKLFPENMTNSSSVTEYVSKSQYESSTNHSSFNSDTASRGLVGLKNLGNTCFMNSVLQCLSNTPELLHYCLKDKYKVDINKNSSMRGLLFQSYAELMNEIWTGSQTPSLESVSPYTFKNQIQKYAPRFMGYSQQDAQEFLRYLLEGLHEDVNRVKVRPPAEVPNYEKEDALDDSTKSELYWNRYLKRDNSIIVDLFMGQLMSTLECTECSFKSTTFDPFWDLSLPISKKASVDIIDCLKLFTSKEELNGVEKPICARCKQRRRCLKWFNIQRFPKILVLHLKRFSGERFRSKMSALVSYPCDGLDLSDFASPTCTNRSKAKYRLYAVSNHSGSCYGGHYTAYCRHPHSGTWAEYNDSRVRSARESSVISSEGYVLFYTQI